MDGDSVEPYIISGIAGILGKIGNKLFRMQKKVSKILEELKEQEAST